MITITLEHPVQENLALLHRRHTADMHADTPPESIHMMSAEALAAPGILFYVLREDGTAHGMGALKPIAPEHAEIKSMHVLMELRGRGLARMLLQHLMTEARAHGFTRLSLETGTQASFTAARRLYADAGFEETGPFGDYRHDLNSLFMTCQL